MIPSSKILDDARKELAKWLYYYGIIGIDCDVPRWEERTEAEREYFMGKATEILAISGTTDIECPDCEGEGTGEWGGNGIMFGFEPCPKCNGAGSIPYEWEMGVHLKNGELPPNPRLDAGYFTQEDIASAGYVQRVK